MTNRPSRASSLGPVLKLCLLVPVVVGTLVCGTCGFVGGVHLMNRGLENVGALNDLGGVAVTLLYGAITLTISALAWLALDIVERKQ